MTPIHYFYTDTHTLIVWYLNIDTYIYIDAYTLILVYWYLYFNTYVLTFIHQHLLVASITYHWCTYKLTLITIHDTCTYYIDTYTLIVLYLSIDTYKLILNIHYWHLNLIHIHWHINSDTYTLAIMHWHFIHWYLTFLVNNTWTPIHCAVKHFFLFSYFSFKYLFFCSTCSACLRNFISNFLISLILDQKLIFFSRLFKISVKRFNTLKKK